MSIVLLEKNEWPPNSPDLKQLDYHMCGPDAGTLSEIYAKTVQHHAPT